jgi:phosphatidate cytidylyltransferase
VKDLLIRLGSAFVAGVIFFGTYFYSVKLFAFALGAAFLFILVFEWPKLCRGNKWLWLLTPIYPVVPMLLLLAHLPIYKKDIWFPLYPFFLAWLADTGGYIFGKLWGYHKICPKVSPKKSWEGLLGSFIFVTCFVYVVRGPGLTPPLALAFSLFITLAALGGDLFESYLKRRAGLKDVGGGVVVAETFVVAVVTRLAMRYF